MKAEPRPTKDVNRDSGTATANGRWFRQLVRPLLVITWKARLFIVRSPKLLCFFSHSFPSIVFSLRLRLLEFRMRFLEIRMVINRCQVICLQRGYLPLYKGYLTPKLMLWSIACINHPVEIIKVFCECSHNVMLWSNDES